MKTDEESIEIRRSMHLGRILGEGGMGQIYEGFESGLGSHAAVKFLREELVGNDEVRQRFDEESHIMASIEHPGCIPIYGRGTDARGRPFYAMKQISGKSLTDLFQERGTETKSFVWRRRLLDIFQSICETVAYAHEHGIIHRDLKPDNVMVGDYGSVYVIDWGLAKRFGDDGENTPTSRTLAGAVMGSPGYMSPEQAEGKTAKTGPEADVFALGVILYEILTGEGPFQGDTDREALAHTVNRDPDDPRKKNPFASRSIAAVAMKALHKDPRQRYRSAADLAADIRAFNEGRPVNVTRPSLLEKTVFFARRKPLRAAVTWGAVVAVLTAVLFFGGQRAIDLRLADKAKEKLEQIDADVVELNQELDELDARMKTATGNEAERLATEVSILRARRLQQEVEALNTLRSVAELRFIRTSDEVHRQAVERLFTMLEGGARDEYALMMHAFTETLLENAEEEKAALRYSPRDLERLREIHRRTAPSGGLSP